MSTKSLAEATTLITVMSTRGKSIAYQLDTNARLTEIRTHLQNKGFMHEDDFFLVGGKTPVDRDAEPVTQLSKILGKDQTLHIGTASVDDTFKRDGVDRYRRLNEEQKKAILVAVDAYRGRLRAPSDGLNSSFHDVCTTDELPAVRAPQVTSEKSTAYAFSEFTRELTVSGVKSGSVSLNVPFGKGEAEYIYEKNKSTSSREVTEQLISRFIVRKVELHIDAEKLKPAPGFVTDIVKAVGRAKDGKPTKAQYQALLAALGKWGFYLPVTITIGGLVYGTENTRISEFEHAESEKQEFGASFEASFKGVGGGAAYKQADGKSNTAKKSTKYENTTLQTLGGSAISSKDDYQSWSSSLDNAQAWRIVEYTEFVPTLLLLRRAGDEALDALNRATKAIERYRNVQPHDLINIDEYNLTIMEAINPLR